MRKGFYWAWLSIAVGITFVIFFTSWNSVHRFPPISDIYPGSTEFGEDQSVDAIIPIEPVVKSENGTAAPAGMSATRSPRRQLRASDDEDQKLSSFSKISAPLREIIENEGSENISVIMWGDRETLRNISRSFPGKRRAGMKLFNSLPCISGTVKSDEALNLARIDGISWITLDREVKALSVNKLRETTGACEAYNLNPGSDAPLDGSGVTIAILDSGVDNEDLRNFDHGNSGEPRIKAVVDLTDENLPEEDLLLFSDYFGHGSHVAGIAAGNGGGGAYPEYAGIAPGADLVILRVLDSEGKGSVTALLKAIDWCITHREEYDLRVMNLSLGAPVTESYATDPLCRASALAVSEGIVVVCSAGNYGKNGKGEISFGSILSPGIEPSVITVGAIDTRGTASRKDDFIASFSSRGPTRGYYVDPESGETYYDNLLKPDLVAPGAWIPSVSSHRDEVFNLIMSCYGHNGLIIEGTDEYMRLNGTSMAAPVVSGAAALMLQANPGLTPALVKGALMFSSQRIDGETVLSQGAGILNIPGAVRLALALNPESSSLPPGANLLVGEGIPEPRDVISDEPIPWNSGIAEYDDNSTPEIGMLASQGVLWADGEVTKVKGIRFKNGLSVKDGTFWLNSKRMGRFYFSKERLCSDDADMEAGSIHGSGVLWSDNDKQWKRKGKKFVFSSTSCVDDEPIEAMSFVDTGDTVLNDWDILPYQTESNFVLVGEE